MINYSDRGKILNKERAQQLNDFTGLKWKNITPTDIDGFVEFSNKAFIFLEAKFGNKKMDKGQKLALERVCGCCNKAGKVSYVLFANHNIDSDKEIDFAKLLVKKYYEPKEDRWIEPKEAKTIKEFIDDVRQEAGIENEQSEDNTDITDLIS